MICEDVCVTVIQVNWLDLPWFATICVWKVVVKPDLNVLPREHWNHALGALKFQSDLLEKQAMATNMGDEVRRLREANKVQYVQWKKLKNTCIYKRMKHDKPPWHLWHQNISEQLQFGGIATSTAPVWGRESQTISTATSGSWVLILGAGNGNSWNSILRLDGNWVSRRTHYVWCPKRDHACAYLHMCRNLNAWRKPMEFCQAAVMKAAGLSGQMKFNEFYMQASKKNIT